MSYPNIEDGDFLENVLSRKELYSLRADPDRNFRDPPEAKDDPLNGKYLKIHSHQLFVRNFINPNTPYKRMHLMHGTGCHAAGTPVLMHDGTICMVENIKIGDQIMGDDSTPRNVLNTVSNVEQMYKVVPAQGEPFVCNESHILSLKCNDPTNLNYLKIIDIKISDYLNFRDKYQSYHLYRVPVDFPEKDVEIDPYLLGWCISGNCREIPAMYTQNNMLTKYIVTECKRQQKEQRIPHDYKCNSRKNRLKLMAGIVDGGGYWDKANNKYVFLHLHERLINDILYLARSLGLTACKQIRTDLMAAVDIYQLIIGGDISQIPMHSIKKSTVIGHDSLEISFTLEKMAVDRYYGFTIDGNHRYLLGCFTVTHNTGKTLAAISIAQEFIKVYRKMYQIASAKMQAGRKNYAELDRSTPTVFVLGFGGTKSAFIRDLMKYPDFGFISATEKEELIKRQKIADAGLPDDIKHFKEFYSMIKKRITNKNRDGFYKFFGYDEFVNRLFLSDEIKLTDIESIATQKLREGENTTLEDIIYEYINDGKIQVNQQLLAMFENSIMICDEIHNTYNMNMKNNRGVAIQFILDSIPNIRFLSLSATPINNSPTEVIELINYLVPSAEKTTKRGFFANSRALLPGKLKVIGDITRGKISFLQDANIKYFPKRIFVGKEILLPKDVGDVSGGSPIPYLKFIECPMSKFHQATYNNYLENVTSQEDRDSNANIDTHDLYSYHSIPTDGYSIYDIAFPNPDSEEYGLFKSSEVRGKISVSSQEWKDKNGISMKKFSAINNILIGDFLLRDNIAKYSTKYAKLIDILTEIISEAGSDVSKTQKIMIYHDRVKMSGVLFLQELLRTNNFLDEHSEPVDTTLCCVCGKSLALHNGTIEFGGTDNHIYKPARFVVAHSDMDKIIMDQSLAKFNSPDNSHGSNYMILIGSKIVKESYDFKDIQNLIIMSLPINIPTLLQVFGRCIRKHSHVNLPPEQRKVNIRILLSTINTKYKFSDSVSPEMYKYIDKLSDYIVIQNIEREFNRNAIDADVHRDIIMPPDLKQEFFPGSSTEPVNAIGNLYFEPANKLKEYNLHDLNLSTFTAYKYHEDEIKTISQIIKRLFMSHPVWTYDDLWAKVRLPPFGVELNPKLFSENNFVISLHNLVNNTVRITPITKNKKEISESTLIERIFDYNDRYIYKNNSRNKIEQLGQYYILFPVADLPENPINAVYAEYMENSRDKERSMIREMTEANDRVIVDVETYIRGNAKISGIRINIESFVKNSREGLNYITKRLSFIESYKSLEDVTNFLSDFSAQFQINFVEESIVSIMGQHAQNDLLQPLHRKIIELLGKFKVIVYLDEIKKYKDTAKQYKFGLPNLPDKTPMGYMGSKTIRLFDPQTENEGIVNNVSQGKWIEISKISLNRHMSYKENDVIVGYLESNEESMKFKLRKPVQLIKEDINRDAQLKQLTKSEIEGITARTVVGDTRLIERGIVCATKNKHELLHIIASLGISVNKLPPADIRIKKLCGIIKSKLMENEMRERQRDSRYKYLYFWWDEQFALSSRI